MRNILCLLGRHRWERRSNPDVGGKGSGYDVCSRCHQEKQSYEPGNPGLGGY